MTNQFLKEATMGAGSAFTENGATSYASTGKELVNQFSICGSARGRDISDVFADQSALWAEDKLSALRFPFYLRMVTRKGIFNDGRQTELVQKGQGAKDESFKRLLWIALNHPEDFYRNLWLLPIVGCWKDLWVMLTMSDQLREDEFFKVIAEGLHDSYSKDLVLKYLPRIRSNNKCKTEWATKTNELAKRFAKFVGWSEKDYRKSKASGKAHEFQRYICSGLYSNIKWNAIPGKALLNLVSGDFLNRHNLTKGYIEWLEKQPTAKFNGYVYELGHKLSNVSPQNLPLATKVTVDKQFDNLIKTASENNGAINGNVWCALDTSGSMTCPISRDSNITAFDVCISLGIYFSTLNKGAFNKNVIMFDNVSRVKQLKGSFSDMYNQITSASTAWGSTNFQSVIDEIVRIRQSNPNIPIEDYPKTLLVVSDMQFNPTGSWGSRRFSNEVENTNYEEAMRKLRRVFPKEFTDDFKIIWWNVIDRGQTDFPSTIEDAGTYFFSGFDGAIISLLLGGEVKVDPVTGKTISPSAEEVIQMALSQEVLQLVN